MSAVSLLPHPFGRTFFSYGKVLLCLFVQRMLSAESTIFLDLHPVGMCLFILCCIVVTLFTFRTCQCYSCTHFSTSKRHFEHKKKT